MTDNNAQRIAELEREVEDLKLRITRIEARHRRLDDGLREMMKEEHR